MHIHASQLSLNAELYAAQAAARAEAKMAAELTRKKLRDFASALAGEAGEDDSCVLALGARGEQQDHSNQRDEQEIQAKRAADTTRFSRRCILGLGLSQLTSRSRTHQQASELGQTCRATGQNLPTSLPKGVFPRPARARTARFECRIRLCRRRWCRFG